MAGTAAAAVVDAEVVGSESEITSIALRQAETTAMLASDSVSIAIDPRVVLAKAADAARALMDAMSKKKHKVVMGNEQYIEVDDWQVVARFYGCSVSIEHDEYVEFGDVHGWEAVATLKDRNGRELGRATMMCLDDEEKWSARTKYEFVKLLKPGQEKFGSIQKDGRTWATKADDAPAAALVWEETTEPKPGGGFKSRPTSERMVIGTERVPMFQLRSMAQTRAAGKVMRLNLGFVPALAGYNSTPAEEVDSMTERVEREPRAEAQTSPAARQVSTAATNGPRAVERPAAAAKPAQAAVASPAVSPAAVSAAAIACGTITQGQAAELWKKVAAANLTQENVAARLKTKHKITKTTDLTPAQYAEVLKWINDPDGDTDAAREPGQEG